VHGAIVAAQACASSLRQACASSLRQACASSLTKGARD